VNIYIVQVRGRSARYIIRAESAQAAAVIVGEVELLPADSPRIEVGRLGTYEPGIEGAGMAPMSIIGTWTIDPA
jgi:hypothetical protein